MFANVKQSIINSRLPIVSQLESISQSLQNTPSLVLQAEPGAGKTTLVPLFLLELVRPNKKILLLEPRRLAARNAALRMADILNEKVGETVGYRVRHETRVSSGTRIEVITEGVLIKILQQDPELSDVDLVIFDEFHERSLNSELGLALAIEIQQALRDSLKLLVMSATLDSIRVSKLLDNAPIVSCEGRGFPVDIHYLPPKKNFDWFNALVRSVKLALQSVLPDNAQDILIFLPGQSEIRQVQQILSEIYTDNNIQLLALYGELPFSQQREVLIRTRNKRKIILSTNIAETSVTIDGIGCVIDSGLMRQSEFDPNVGFSRLKTVKISKASAVQRSGRAGRLSHGLCYRLWSESERLRDENQPAIMREDLASFVLELALWGSCQLSDFKLLDKPAPGAFQQALSLLKSLGAISENNRITAHGKALNLLGVHPRIAHMLMESVDLGVAEFGCVLAAMLEEKDILQGEARNQPDFMARINCLLDLKFSSHTQRKIIKQSKILLNNLKPFIVKSHSRQRALAESIDMAPRLLALVFPDRIAQKRGGGFRLTNGSGVFDHSGYFTRDEFLVVIKLGGQGSTAKIFQAIRIDIDDLESCFADLLIEQEVVDWDDSTLSVKAERQVKLGELVLKSQNISPLKGDSITNCLLKGIRKNGMKRLPWNNQLRQWQARIQMLRQFECFEAKFPDVSDTVLLDSLEKWLSPYLIDLSKVSQITIDKFTQALRNQLDWQQQKELDRLMPVSIKVASGSNVRIDYQKAEKPILAVRLQEMLGEKNTPVIADGQLPVVVHLLSPANRPLQITEDLASFWINGYLEVKKQMKGKYPKHIWPDDPLKAQATRYTKSKQAKINQG